MSSVSPSQSASNVGSRDGGVSAGVFDSKFQELLALMTKPPAWVDLKSAPAQREFLGTVRAGFLCLERAVLGGSELSCQSESDGGLYLGETSVSLLSSQVRKRRRRVRRWRPGCCYLAAVLPACREEVQELLGENPSLGSLLRVGAGKFQPREVIERLRVSVDDGLAHVHVSGDVRLVDVLVRAAAFSKYGAGTFQAEISSWAIPLVSVPPVDSVGGVTRGWVRDTFQGTRIAVEGTAAGIGFTEASLGTVLEAAPSQLVGLQQVGDSVMVSSVKPMLAQHVEEVSRMLVSVGLAGFRQDGESFRYSVRDAHQLRSVSFVDEDSLQRKLQSLREAICGGSGEMLPVQLELESCAGIQCVDVAVSEKGGFVWWLGPGACVLRVPFGVVGMTARGAVRAGGEVLLPARSMVRFSIDSVERAANVLEFRKVLVWRA